MALGLCGPADNEVYSLVYEGWETQRSLGLQQALGLEDQMREFQAFLEQVQLAPIETTFQYSADPSLLGSDFRRPEAPTPKDMTYQAPQPPLQVDLEPVTPAQLSERPTFSATPPVLDFSGQPQPFQWADIDDAVSLTDVNLPTSPDIPLPVVSELRARLQATDLPAASPLDLPEWVDTRPVDDTYLPEATFQYDEADYSSTTLTKVAEEIERVLAGPTTGLRAEVWAAIQQQSVEREQEAAIRHVEGVRTRWSRAGWDAPGGVAIDEMDRAHQAVMQQEATQSRTVMVEQAKMEVENLRKAIAEGVALEQMLVNLHSGRQERRLRAAQISQDVIVRLAGLAITRLQARHQAYATDAQVFRDRMAAELARLDERRLAIEEARLKGEDNDREIRIFLAEYEAADKLIQKYLGELEGVKRITERDKLAVEWLGERVRVRAEQVKAKGLEYDGWKAKVEGQLGIANVYRTEAQAFGDLMRAYGTESEAAARRVDSDVRVRELALARARVDNERFAAQSRSEDARLAALAREMEALTRLFEGKSRVERDRVDSDINRGRLLNDQQRAQEQLRIEKSKVDIGQIFRVLDIEKDVIGSMLNVRSQLVASLYSAFNLNGSVSGSFENAAVCQTNYEG